MRPIIIVMLLVDLVLIVVTSYGVALRHAPPGRPRPYWTNFVIALLIGGTTSLTIASEHPGDGGSKILAMIGPLMMGMAIMAALASFRERRGAGTTPTDQG